MAKTSTVIGWAAAGSAVLVLILTGYSVLTGDHHSSHPGAGKRKGRDAAGAAPSSPAPTYTVPDDWTEPARWVALPRGTHTSHGLRVGFPHTTTGAVAMFAAADTTSAEGGHTLADEQRATFEVYTTADGRTATVRARVRDGAERTEAGLRRGMGLPVHGDLPPGAFVRTSLVGFKVIAASRSEVSVYLLTGVARKAGETAAERDGYVVGVLAARWEHGDWKISPRGSARAARQAGSRTPALAAPGDAAFNSAGWTAIRAAS